MSATRPQDVVRQLLADPTNPDVVNALVAPDATYVSLADDNPELKPNHALGRHGQGAAGRARHVRTGRPVLEE